MGPATPSGAQALSTASPLWYAKGEDGSVKIKLYFFHNMGCPHCNAAKLFLARVIETRPWLELQTLDVEREENERLFFMLAREFQRQPEAVPSFFLCGRMLVGFDTAAGTGAELARIADACHVSALQRLRPLSRPSPSGTATTTGLELPFVGRLNFEQLSLPALTLILGGLDAFNPCAIFVLLFLLSLMVHAKSRVRMAVIGGLFITVSGVMYFIFMAAWLNLFLILQHIGWITAAAGVVALIIGALAIKDSFHITAGPSLSIPQSAKPALFQRMGRLMNTRKLPVLLLGTALLAVSANLYELLCTSGFPLVYTQILTQNDLSATARYSYLAVYNIVYIIPLFAIVALFVTTLGARKLSEREGRALKLLSGLMMTGLGLLLVLAPDLLRNVLIAAGLLLIALLLTALILIFDHFLLRKRAL